MPVEEQVVVLYAASNGYLDEIDTDAVPDWERQFRDFMRDTHGDLLDSIRSEQEISDEVEEKLREAIEQFNSNYEPQHTSLVDVSVGDEEDEEDSASESENEQKEDQPREEEGS
jgi:F-type H+-transporting ATPase subunit alpha